MSKSEQSVPGQASGPRTAAGKARVAKNALRHGLTGRAVLLGDEDPAAYQALREALFAQHAPEGETERFLVQRMSGCMWRLLRCAAIEAELLETLRHPDVREGGLGRAFLITDGADGGALVRLARYETALERAFHRALRALSLLQTPRRAGADSAGAHAVPPEASSLDWLEQPARAAAFPLPYPELPPLPNPVPVKRRFLHWTPEVGAAGAEFQEEIAEGGAESGPIAGAASPGESPSHRRPKPDEFQNKPPARGGDPPEGVSRIIAARGWANDPSP